MKNNPWLVRLRNTSIPEHKLRPAKWLALTAGAADGRIPVAQ